MLQHNNLFKLLWPNNSMNKRAQILIILLILVGILALLLLIYISIYPPAGYKTLGCLSENCVSRVIDGDTFVLTNGKSVRLICVNTPERGDEGYSLAKHFLQGLIENKEVRLEKDVSETDMYNRLLRYVYVNVTNSSGNFEVFVNRELYQKGFADIMRYPPDVKRCEEIKN